MAAKFESNGGRYFRNSTGTISSVHKLPSQKDAVYREAPSETETEKRNSDLGTLPLNFVIDWRSILILQVCRERNAAFEKKTVRREVIHFYVY